METPSSTRRVTRSQTLAASANSSNIRISRNFEESEKSATKSKQTSTRKQQERSALVDITNDSPIVGLAMGSLETPSSRFSKKRISTHMKHNCTPGSGEALLRGQVKTLLQKVEEEAEFSKIFLENRPPLFNLHVLGNSPMRLLAPTPANTPQIPNLSDNSGVMPIVSPSPVEDKLVISQMVLDIFDGYKEEGSESDNDVISRALDFSEKSDVTDSSVRSSVMTYQGGPYGDSGSSREKIISADDDDSSVWSIQVNASRRDEEEDEDEDCVGDEVDEEYDYEEEEVNEVEEDYSIDFIADLCEEMSKVSVNGGLTAKFTGKHTRFVYNSDDELEGEEEVLKGLPMPTGKHTPVSDDEEEEK